MPKPGPGKKKAQIMPPLQVILCKTLRNHTSVRESLNFVSFEFILYYYA